MTIDLQNCIRETSKKDYIKAYFGICEAQYQHTHLLQSLSKHDLKTQQKSKDAVRFHERVKQEIESLKIEGLQNQTFFLPQKAKLIAAESQNNDSHLSSQTLSSRRLPIELNYEIVEHILASDPSPERQQMLKTLCETSNDFRQIAETHLYEDVGDLDTLEKQWKFGYAIAIQPELTKRVKKVHLFWQAGGANGNLLLEICSACTNIEELLIQRGQQSDEKDTFDQQDGVLLFKILQSCKNLKSFTWACFIPPHKIVEVENTTELESNQGKDIFSSLVHLDLRGWTSYFSNVFFENLTEKIESITLGPQCEVKEEELNAISRKCPALQNLSIKYSGGVEAIDLISFARDTPQLKSLQISKVNQDDQPDWFSNILYERSWNSLQSIHFGMGWTVTRSIFAALALPFSPSLKSLYIWDIDDEVAETGEDIIVQMLERQAQTLQECHLGGPDFFTAGKATLIALQNAKNLQTLSLPSLHDDISAKDVDILLTKCPQLSYICSALKNVSGNKAEWEARESSHSNQMTSNKWANTRLGS